MVDYYVPSTMLILMVYSRSRNHIAVYLWYHDSKEDTNAGLIRILQNKHIDFFSSSSVGMAFDPCQNLPRGTGTCVSYFSITAAEDDRCDIHTVSTFLCDCSSKVLCNTKFCCLFYRRRIYIDAYTCKVCSINNAGIIIYDDHDRFCCA